MTYVWIYESRNNGRPVNLRLVRFDEVPEDWHLLSARFPSPTRAAGALQYYLEFDMEGHTIINDRHVGKPVGWTDQMILAFRAAPWLVGLLGFTCLMSIVTFVALLIHVL